MLFWVNGTTLVSYPSNCVIAGRVRCFTNTLPCGASATEMQADSGSPSASLNARQLVALWAAARSAANTSSAHTNVHLPRKLIDIRFAPELIWHTGNTTWREGKDALGNPIKEAMPDFYVLRLQTALTCISGQYMLAGVVSPKDNKGEVDMTRKVMVFVKCDVLVVK